MASLTLTHHINDRQVQKGFDQLMGLGEDMTPVFQDIGEHLLWSTEQRFRSETGPDGRSWVPNMPSTKARKRHPKTLTESGRLRGSITYQASADQVEIGSNLIYAAIHQLGGKAGKGKKIKIPARPYLGLSAEDEAEINHIVQDHLSRALRA